VCEGYRDKRNGAIPGDGGRTESIISIKRGRGGEGWGGKREPDSTNRREDAEGGAAVSGVCLL